VYLVDTSAWIEIFRKGSRLTIDQMVDDRDQIVTCLPVIQEVLQGFHDERAFQIARTAMLALPCVELPITLPVIESAVDVYRRARRAGVTVRSSVDCLVAACAARHHLTVVHRDRNFAQIAKVVHLEHIDIGPRAREPGLESKTRSPQSE
jgi:predicted nucleic acid-binding protein